MTHNHGSEYQIRIVHDDGTEELTAWVSSQEEILQAIAALPPARARSLWLRERNTLCPYCSQQQRVVAECLVVGVPTQRYSAHDSHHLVAMGSKNRCEVFGVSFGHRY